MYAPANLARYGAVQVNTASPGRILVMLYDALARFLREGADAMDAKDKGRAAQKVNAAYNILNELLGTMDQTQNPDLCATLEKLYGFCMRHLIAANIAMDAAKVREVGALIAPLREAFSAAVVKKEEDSAPRSQPMPSSGPISVRMAG